MFEESLVERVSAWPDSEHLQTVSKNFTQAALRSGYTYNFSWLGKTIIQMPEDLVNLQDIVFRTRPDVIIETGVARGGSALFYASLLYLNSAFKSSQIKPCYIGLDISIRQDTRDDLSSSPFGDLITLIETDTSSPTVTASLLPHLTKGAKVMLILDSCHTTEHVSAEIRNLSHLVSPGCYLIVCDTTVGIHGPAYENCRYGVDIHNSPYQALASIDSSFTPDTTLHNSQLASCNLMGYYIKA